MGKKVLILLAVPDITTFTADLAKAYKRGARKTKSTVVEINIHDLHFQSVIDPTKITLKDLEPDLKMVRGHILDADQIVFLSEIQKDNLDYKLFSFFNRLFSIQDGLPMKNLWSTAEIAGKTVRVISVLDDEVWKEYKKKGRHNEFNPVKKHALNLFGFSTVRTTTLGSVKKGVFNEYYYKWINKLILLGERQY